MLAAISSAVLEGLSGFTGLLLHQGLRVVPEPALLNLQLESAAAADSLMTELIISLSLMWIREYFISFCQFLKFLFSYFVTGIFIRVMFHC